MRFLIRSTLFILGIFGIILMRIFSSQPDVMPRENALAVISFNNGETLRSEVRIADNQNHQRLIYGDIPSAVFFVQGSLAVNQVYLLYIQLSVYLHRYTWPAGKLDSFPHQQGVYYLRPPDGQLVYLQNNTGFLTDLQGKTLLPGYPVQQVLGFSPDGRHLLFRERMPNTSARVLYLADLTTQTTQTIAVDDFARYLMVWLPTDWIIMLVQDVSSNSLQLTRQRLDQLSDISDSQTDVLYHFRDGGAPSVLLTSPDGHWIAFEDWNKFILLTPETGDTRVLLDLSTIANSSVTNWELLEWSPDGQWIYYYLEENNVTTLYRKPPFAFSNAEAQPLATLPHLSTYDLTWLLLHREAWPRGQIWIMASGSIVLSIGLTAVRAKSPWRWHANASTKG